MDSFSSAVELARLVRNRELSPVEVVGHYLDRIERFNPIVNAIVWRNDEELRAAARAAEKAVLDGGPLGPFHGVPIPIKEHQSVAGWPNTMGGSLGISDAPQQASELAVERLADAGFLFMGRSNAPEMGPMSVTENARYGATRNPWNPDYSPGGSSGGAAAAVIAGLAPVAHASDGGGSIRMPSSCCGTVGFKPSRGRVPTRVPSWEHAITEGAITRHIADSAAILDVMSTPDPYGWYNALAPERPFAEEVGRDTGRLRIGLLLEAPTGVPVDPACEEAALTAARLLEELGHDVVPVAPRLFSREAGEEFLNIIVNAWLYLNPYDQPELAEPYIRHRMRRATEHHIGEYVLAAARLYREAREVVAQWGQDFDVLLTPTLATRTPRVGVVLDRANRDPDGPRITQNQMIAFTSFANISGLPAVSLPVHTDAEGLPVGAQLVAGPWQEDVLFRLGAALEALVLWTDTVPDPYR
jgi:amidase